MRTSVIQIIIAVLFAGLSLANPAHGQELLMKKISLDINNTEAKKVLTLIEQQSNVRFAYRPRLISNGQKISLHLINQPLKDVLDILTRNLNLQYDVMGEQIILSPAGSSETGTRPQPSTGGQPGTSGKSNTDRTIKGKVTDERGESLPGATVVVKGTQNGTLTNVDGQFEIITQDGIATLVFSFVGYLTQEIVLSANQSSLDITLQSDQQTLDELVVVGYGTVKKSDLTGAVARLNAEQFQNQPLTQITEMLAGTVAGFASNQSAGAAGGGSMEIRGPNSISAGSSPMIVLDGIIYNGSIRDINPSDIETIDILKDASSAAVYGSRAASGVILITTKRGKSATPVINFTAKWGVSSSTNKRKPLNGEEFVRFRQDFFRTTFPNIDYDYYTHPNQLPPDLSIDQWRQLSANPQSDNVNEWMARMKFFSIEQQNYLAGKTTDWYNEVMQNGKTQDYDISIGGKNDNINYYWSIGYLNNEGLRVGDKYSNLRSKINSEYTINRFMKVGVNAQFSNRDESAVPASLSFYANSPYGQMYDDKGNLIRLPHGHTENPLLDYYRKSNLRKITSLFTNLYMNFKLPLDIEYQLSFQPRIEYMKELSFTSTDIRVGGLPSDVSQGSRAEYSHYEWMVDNLFKWNKQLGSHHIDLTFLFNIEESNRWATSQSNKNFAPSEQLGFHGIHFGDSPTINNDDYRSTGDALMFRANYTIADKYLLTGSVRRDGFSAFGQENPRAFFPAFALAWRLSNEDFFNVDAISQLKIRTSWGINGNRDIGIYSSLARINSNLWYDGTNTRVGVFNSTLANSLLKWEKTQSINLGIDVTFKNQMVDLSVDFYDMTTKDLLLNRNLPSITGFSQITSNLGELGNKGIDLTVNTNNIKTNDFSWSSGLTFSFNRNKIKKLFGDIGNYKVAGINKYGEIPDFTNRWFPDHSLDAIWDYKITGVWQIDEKETAERYGMRPGDFKSEDLDNDGRYIELNDKQFIGYTSPRYRIGLNNSFSFFRNFSANLFLRADLGHMGEYSNALNAGWESNDRANRNVGPVPYWTEQNPINDYARLDVSNSGYGGGLRVFKQRSFIRLQDINLSYHVPSGTAEKLKMRDLRFFGSIRNLLTYTKWPHWDPETGSSPLPKTFSLGFSMNL